MRSLAVLFIIALSGCASHPAASKDTTGQAMVYLQGLSKASPNQVDAMAQDAEHDPSFQPEGKAIESTESRQDVKWGAIYLKADAQGIHYNINQAAKEADSLADDWSLVFSAEAPFRNEDAIYFCGPAGSFGVQLLDLETSKILYDGKISGVAACE